MHFNLFMPGLTKYLYQWSKPRCATINASTNPSAATAQSAAFVCVTTARPLSLRMWPILRRSSPRVAVYPARPPHQSSPQMRTSKLFHQQNSSMRGTAFGCKLGRAAPNIKRRACHLLAKSSSCRRYSNQQPPYALPCTLQHKRTRQKCATVKLRRSFRGCSPARAWP